MISIQLRHERRIERQKLILKRNISKAVTYKKTKYVFKIQNTNSHIYLRAYEGGSNIAIISVSTIKYRKDAANAGLRITQLLEKMIAEFIDLLKTKNIFETLEENQVIWYLGGGKYQGRIKTLITIFLHNLKNKTQINSSISSPTSETVSPTNTKQEKVEPKSRKTTTK